MLPSESRVRRGDEFARTIRSGRRSGRTHLVAYLAVATGPEGSEKAIDEARTGPVARAGFVVGKAVGNAVVRNRVRRRLRHLCAARLDALPTGSILVIRALPSAAQADSALLGRELDSALKRLTGGGPGGPSVVPTAERRS
ncbi:ribonuclease P protein component [Actinospica durhamensis]|uniref:Ribonuclease P protein component n=1 Tax=Actinospica durhamensis TaxID=1508375 RepID=A0A941INU2_9ACTN|nr:ribonuclease P protein component [Actinospica durhamensis]MBR7834359.1 ribonuclease P protein component [Actinospica durhamensis]